MQIYRSGRGAEKFPFAVMDDAPVDDGGLAKGGFAKEVAREVAMEAVLTARGVRSRRVVIFLVVATAIAGVMGETAEADAQIINVLSQITQRDEDGLGGSLSGSISWQAGNTKVTDVKAGAALAARAASHAGYVIAQGQYAEQGEEGEVFIRRSFEHLRYRYRLLLWLELEAFTQHEFDEFRRLRLRAVVGSGPRFTWHPDASTSVIVGIAPMAEYEVLADVAPGEEGGTWRYRLSSYLNLATAIDERLSFVATAFVQPRFDDFQRDLRVLTRAGLVIKLNAALAVDVSYNMTHDGRPPAGVKKTDQQLSTSLSLTF